MADPSAGGSTLGKRGYVAAAKRVIGEIRSDHLTLLSGGIAFYALVAIFPALLAAISVYGLVSDPEQVQQQIASFASALPGEPGDGNSVEGIFASGMSRAVEQDSGALTLSFVASLAGALWTASVGVAGLVDGVNAAYNLADERPFLKRRGLALLLTVGAIIFVVVAVGLIAVVPVVLRFVGLAGMSKTLINVARWPLLTVAIMGALAVIYRVGPYRKTPKTRWRSPGAVVATVLFLVVSAGLSLYVSSFGGGDSYANTYGALAGVIVLLFWLFLSAFAILLGAEVNSELEHQYRLERSTAGSMSVSRKDAYLADTGTG